MLDFFNRAVKLWSLIQPTRQLPEVEIRLLVDHWLPEEDSRSKYNTLPGNEQSQLDGQRKGGRPVAVLFPQIYAGNTDEDKKTPLFHGFALFNTQRAVIAAEQECAQLMEQQQVNNDRRRSGETGRSLRHTGVPIANKTFKDRLDMTLAPSSSASLERAAGKSVLRTKGSSTMSSIRS
jgi:hypothetical protein